jgi:hypothetical protein
MPLTLYSTEIQTSVRGRELGLDNQRRLVGPPDYRTPTELSTAGSTLDERGGLAVLSGSTDVWTLRAPLVPGVNKYVVNASTLSTATMSLVRSTANGACSFLGTTIAGGIAGGTVRLNLLNSGSAIHLISVSSAVWAPVSNMLTSLYYTNSTSS